ncbi:acyl-CoA thioesterase [Bacillus dakarensis]|uniref:acyl-CoA thioesterase n=1 Tax=Robertmurraya dakarensis TaxID=1926278 RepID=UPI0023517DA8|nr:thioesterase family protein [Bacillus dakarensis]
MYVRFSETDAAGHVNNVSYYIYLEEARTKFFDFIQIEQIKRDAYPNLRFVVASSHCNYLRQAYAKQYLKVSTKITKIGTKSFILESDIKNAETGEIIASGGAVMVCFNFETEQSVEIPHALREILEQYLA